MLKRTKNDRHLEMPIAFGIVSFLFATPTKLKKPAYSDYNSKVTHKNYHKQISWADIKNQIQKQNLRLVNKHFDDDFNVLKQEKTEGIKTMVNYSTNTFKSGLKVMVDGDPCSILEKEFVNPGKGQAFNRVKLRNLKTGRVIERTFKSGESLPGADIVDIEMHYLYKDALYWYFMDNRTYEQYQADKTAMAEAVDWIKEQDVCTVTLYNGEPLTVMPPASVILKVVATEPGVKGDTASGGNKPAKLETGATVKVPLFIDQEEYIKVNTRTGEYLSRAKKP